MITFVAEGQTGRYFLHPTHSAQMKQTGSLASFRYPSFTIVRSRAEFSSRGSSPTLYDYEVASLDDQLRIENRK